jgi:hypothetical protein
VTGWKRIFSRVLGSVLPRNDPDFFLGEKPVAYWWLELEGAEGRREIGFSASNEVIRFAPIAENRGLFVGEELAPRHLSEHLSAEEFEEAWGRALKTWPHLGR